MVQQKTVIVKGKYNGLRLDQFIIESRFLASFKKTITRPELRGLIERGVILVNGERLRPGHRMKPGDSVIYHSEQQKKELVPILPMPKVTVLYESAHFLVIDKPAGLSMHPVHAGQKGTLVDWILEHYPRIAKVGEDPLRPGIVHRLDKDTSGVVIIAQNQTTFMALKKLFQERKVKKLYLALVHGHMKEENGLIEASLGRVRGSIRRGVDHKKRVFAGELREAITEYHLHTRYAQYDLLSLEPKTGRTHQLRVHLAGKGHPVVGDKLYTFKIHKKDPLQPSHQLLHATALSFTFRGKEDAFTAPLPEYFEQALQTLAPSEKGRK